MHAFIRSPSCACAVPRSCVAAVVLILSLLFPLFPPLSSVFCLSSVLIVAHVCSFPLTFWSLLCAHSLAHFPLFSVSSRSFVIITAHRCSLVARFAVLIAAHSRSLVLAFLSVTRSFPLAFLFPKSEHRKASLKNEHVFVHWSLFCGHSC